MKILVTPTSLQPDKGGEALKTLQEFSDDLIFNKAGRPLSEDELIPLLKDCDGYVAGLDYITEKVIRSCPNLKAISRYGAGYDRVDIDAARENGIPVTNTPGVNAEAVGELAVSLMLALARNITYLDRETRSGKWIRSTGMELKGKTLGILGLGAIGKVVARCAAGLEMNVIAYDPYIDEEYCSSHNIGIRAFDELIREADVISLHLPLTDSTRHLIDKDAIARMKLTAILINTSRGGIIDEEAAWHALKEDRLGALGLDAFETEPPTESKLFELDSVIVTPHTGAHTKEATDNMSQAAIKNLVDILSGKECRFIVNR